MFFFGAQSSPGFFGDKSPLTYFWSSLRGFGSTHVHVKCRRMSLTYFSKWLIPISFFSMYRVAQSYARLKLCFSSFFGTVIALGLTKERVGVCNSRGPGRENRVHFFWVPFPISLHLRRVRVSSVFIHVTQAHFRARDPSSKDLSVSLFAFQMVNAYLTT